MTSVESVPDRDRLRAIQLGKLKDLLTDILPGNRFYATKLAAAGVGVGTLEELADLQRLPFTTKEELQEDQTANPPYGSNLTYALGEYVRLHQTSGTSGRPVYWLDTRESWAWVVRCWDVIFAAAGVNAGDTFFVPFGYGPFLGFWGAFEGAIANGHLTIAGGGMSSATRLRWVRDHGITVVASTPTYALRLAEIARTEGIDLADSDVRLLIVAGEPGGSVAEVRALLEASWGARCIDHWGMTEVGPLGFEPLERPGGVHLLETDCIAEVIDPETLRPIDGESGRGELVITTLERRASPLIRYRTGDLVDCSVSGDGAKAPRNPDLADLARLREGTPFLRLEGGILGRSDQMVLVRGNNVYPAAIDAILGPLHEVIEYRAVVLEAPTGNRLRLEIETANGPDRENPLESRIVAEFKEKLFFRPEIRRVPSGSLPRFEFKARRFVRLKAGEDGGAGR